MLKINYSKCVGCETCVRTYPDHFQVVYGAVSITNPDGPNEAAAVCPNEAIEVQDEKN